MALKKLPALLMKRTAIADAANKAVLSNGTVSTIINNIKNSVGSKIRNHILEVMKELSSCSKGIVRNSNNGSQDKSIGIIIKDLKYPFYTSIAYGAREYANRKGYSLIITCTDNSYESEKNFSYLFSKYDIRGTIMAPIVEGTAEIEHLFKLKRINYPFVLLEAVKGIQANVVAIDNIKAIKKAVKYLINSGHKRIVHFAGPPKSFRTEERIWGFRHAFSESTLVFHHNMIEYVGYNYDESFSKTINYFRNKNRDDYPTAIVCFNDQQALAVMKALKELYIHVPNDISIVGNDDIDYARISPVPLTTIRAPLHEIGRKAAEILIRNIESPTQLPTEHVILETEFIIRESTKVLNN